MTAESTFEQWRDFDVETLSRQYSPSSCVDDFDALIAAYVSESKAAEARTEVHKNLAFSAHPDETLDFFPATNGAPLHVFIHGGYWQELTKNESTFAAPDFVENGIAFAAVNYTLAPEATIGEIISQCRRSIAWLYRNAEHLGVDRERITVSGSSAGAHLAVMLLLTDWRDHGLPDNPIKGAALLSGVYDLRPLCTTYINEALGMDEAEAVRLSPLFRRLNNLPPTIVCWAENETSEFKRQGRIFFDALVAGGNPTQSFEVPDLNHFDLVHTLGDVETPLGQRVLAQIRSA